MNSTHENAASLCLCALLSSVAPAALADVQWTYDETTRKLTEILPEGSSDTASVYGLSADGRLTKSVHGTTKSLDFRRAALPDNAPDVKVVADIRENSSCEAVFLPETLTKFEGCTFYRWTALKRIEFPDEVPSPFSINGQTFEGCAFTNSVVFPKGVTSIGNSVFNGCSKLKRVTLPDTLEKFGNNSGVFQGADALEVVEPLLPRSVTNVCGRSLQNSAMTNDCAIGFATDDAGEPVPLPPLLFATFWNTKVHSIRFGPGVNSFKEDVFWDGAPNLGYVEVGPNVTNLMRSLAQARTALTNVVFLRTADIALPTTRDGQGNTLFHNCKILREITWSGWFTYSTGTNPFSWWSDLQCRFMVPGANPKWSAYMNDSSKVLPWSECSEEDKATYFGRYGEDAATPVGVSVAVNGGLPRTYIVSDGQEPSGAVLNVASVDEEFGTLTVVPSPDNEDGTYKVGTEVTVSFEPVEGVTFDGWSGDVAEADRASKTVRVVAAGSKSLTAKFTSSFFVLKDGTLTDGETAVFVSGELDALSVTSLKALRSDGVLDLRSKPVKGGRIAELGNNAFDQRNGEVKSILLPDTLVSVGRRAVVNCRRNLVYPMLPTNVTYVGGSAFLWEGNITGSVSLGYATGADGSPVETVLDAAGCQFARCFALGPEVRLGPGIRSLPVSAFACIGSTLNEPISVSVGPNVTNAVADVFGSGGDGRRFGGSNPVTFTFEGDMFRGSSKMFYSFDGNGKCTSAPADYGIRFCVGAQGCRKWRDFLSDAKSVTPWADLDEEVQAKYWAKFPAETFGSKKPFGLTTSAAVQTNDLADAWGLPARQWVFSLSRPGFMVILR